MKTTSTICCQCLFAVIFFLSSTLIAEETLSMRTYRGKSITPFLKDITDLCVTIYKEYPYLYEGTQEEYFPFIEHYAHSEHGIACLLFDNERLVGVAIGMPLNEMRDKYQAPFTNARPQENFREIFYLGEFLLVKDYRGRGLGKKIYLEFERSVTNMKKICFCKIDETDRKILETENYRPLDGFWEKFGFHKCEDVSVTVNWQNVGELEESPHQLVYWLKSKDKTR